MQLRSALKQSEALRLESLCTGTRQSDVAGSLDTTAERADEEVAEQAIEDAQIRYRLAVKATNDAIWDWDLKENHVLWNEALERVYGHPLATVEMTGDWWIAQIHPDDRHRLVASIHDVIDGRQTGWSDEYRFRRVDGTYAQVLDRGHVIRDVQGNAVRMIGAMLDLTPIRDTEAALRQSEERFRTILETIDTAFAIVQVKFDANDYPVDYRFVEANPAFEREAGVNPGGNGSGSLPRIWSNSGSTPMDGWPRPASRPHSKATPKPFSAGLTCAPYPLAILPNVRLRSSSTT